MSTAPARLTAPRSAAQPQRRRADEHRAPLRVVERRAARARRRILAPVLSAAMVSLSLFIVVIAHSELAQGQVRLARIQSAITNAQTLHRQELLALAQLESPSRILRKAEQSLHMTSANTVHQLPHVSLRTPLPDPSVAPAAGTSTPPAAHGG